MVVRAVLSSIRDTLNFILDTGSSGISIDSTSCSRHNIKSTPTDTIIRGLGKSGKVNYVFDQDLHFPGLTVKQLNFHVNDYSLLTSVYGENIDGIIGYSFFSRYIVKINFDSMYVEVYTPGKIKYPGGGYSFNPLIRGIPSMDIAFKDRKRFCSDFYFDTGAGLNFLINEAYVKDSNILRGRQTPLETQAEGMGGKVKMRLTVIKAIRVGKYKFRNVPTYLFEDEFNVTAYPRTGGLVGNDLLRRFNLTINYPKSEIHLAPNSHFHDPFDYAYTGLSIYFESGAIYIEDVIPGSPGDRAGIKNGDILIGVNNNFTNNIIQYKALLQATMAKIKLAILRDGELHLLTVKPVSIL